MKDPHRFFGKFFFCQLNVSQELQQLLLHIAWLEDFKFNSPIKFYAVFFFSMKSNYELCCNLIVRTLYIYASKEKNSIFLGNIFGRITIIHRTPWYIFDESNEGSMNNIAQWLKIRIWYRKHTSTLFDFTHCSFVGFLSVSCCDTFGYCGFRLTTHNLSVFLSLFHLSTPFFFDRAANLRSRTFFVVTYVYLGHSCVNISLALQLKFIQLEVLHGSMDFGCLEISLWVC
jgi:hypothetical protein